MRETFTRDEILEALKDAAGKASDDCEYSGILTAGENILGIDKDTLDEEYLGRAFCLDPDILNCTVSYEDERFRTTLSYIGEGYDGEYDEDMDDEPLLRIDIWAKDEDGEWECEERYSTCTGISARISEENAMALCEKIGRKLGTVPDEKIEYEGDEVFRETWESVVA